MTTPFSYHLYHKPTQKHYYGIRFAKNCSPADLWTTYFSSSKIVKQLIAEYGADSFDVAIRRIFPAAQDALLWEHKVLRRLNASAREDWINRHNGGTKFRAPQSQSVQTRKKISQKTTGVEKTVTHKNKISQSSVKDRQRRRENGWTMPQDAVERASQWRKDNRDSFYTPERNAKIAESKRGAKRKYLPDGSFIMVKL